MAATTTTAMASRSVANFTGALVEMRIPAAAEAICTAACQPHIPFVPKKTATQQDIQALHRARQRMVNHRTAVVSQIRGLLLDRGFAIAKSITRARRAIPEIISDLENELTTMAREAITELYDLFRDLDRRIASFDKKIDCVLPWKRRLSANRQDQGCRPKDCHGNRRRCWRWLGVQERAPPGGLGRSRSATTFQRRSQGADGHLQAREPAPAKPARSRRPRRRANGAKQNRSQQSMGEPTSGAARVQPRNGGGRQQERTDHLGRASNSRAIPRRF